jgi:imidazolonepropionase-like amidohydrolase
MWLLFSSVAGAAPLVLEHATIHPVASDPIEDGVLVVDGARIVSVGVAGSVVVPPDAVRIDLTGKHLVPGLVDTHSHIGTTHGDLHEASGPLQPMVSAVDSIDVTHPSLELARAGGITTVNIMPGSGNLVGGQTAYLKLRDGVIVDDLLLCADRRSEICGGLKMANGTNPIEPSGTWPRSRMGAAAQARQLFVEAKTRQADSGQKKRKQTDRRPDLRLDPIVEVLDGRRIVHFHTHRTDDVATALSIADEFGFRPVLHHVSEAWKAVDLLAERGAPCSLIIIDSPGGKEEAVEIAARSAAALEQRGVKVAFHTDDPITDSRLFLRSAGLAVRAGMTEAGALRALTLSGAEMLGLEKRVGSIEVGKDADFVVLSGPPLSVWTHVEQTWVDGAKVFDRADPDDLRFAVGGWERR